MEECRITLQLTEKMPAMSSPSFYVRVILLCCLCVCVSDESSSHASNASNSHKLQVTSHKSLSIVTIIGS